MQNSYDVSKKNKSGSLSPRFKLSTSRAALSLLVAVIAAIGTSLIVRSAPMLLASITATKTDAFVGTHDGDGKADPGETIEYTVAINNTGAIPTTDDATNVTFTDTIDSNTTLVPSSLNVSPLAGDDTYATLGNTLLEVGVTASGAPAVSVTGAAIDSLFDNDIEFIGDSFTLLSVEADTTAPFTTATESGGSVTVESDGNFSYTPPVGFTGADHFDYVITDDGAVGSGALTGAGRVTINVNAQKVWYVNNDAAAGGLGRSSDPFDTLLEAQTASAANDTIYIFYAGGDLTGQDVGIILKDGQRLIGEGVALDVAVSLTQQGVAGSNPTPLKVAGSLPRIGNTGGNGVSAVNDIPGEIRGLSLSGSANAIDITINDASVGTLQIKNNTVFGAGAEGFDINHTGSATLTLDVQNNTWNTGGTHVGNAFDANANGTGRLSLNFSTNTNILSTGASGVVLADTGGAGTLAVTGFANNTVHQNTLLNGISANTVIFDATVGGTFQVVSGGTTTIGVLGDGVGGGGMLLTTVSGNLSFTDLDIVASNGTGLSATSLTAYTGSAGFQIAVASSVATVAATNGPAVDLSIVAATLPFLDIDTANSSSTGVSLASVTGSFSAGSGSTISNAGTTDFVVSNSNATITYSGLITDSAGAGVSLTTNTGSTITFNGGLSISSGASTAFSATGGGTVNVCDENVCNPAATGSVVNTLTSTSGTALNVANTDIGANNLEFRSISSNGAASGIVLNTTGSGNLVVKGNGGSCTSAGTCTGGAIQNSTSYGISLTNTTSPSFTRIAIVNAGRSGIDGQQVTNFTLANSFIDNVGTAAAGQYEESNLAFNDGGTFTSSAISGTVSITNNILTNARRAGIMIENGNGTISNLTISNNTLTSSTNSTVSLGNAIHVLVQGSASLNAHLTTGTISGNTITNFPSGEGILIAGGAGNGSNNTSSTLGANGTPINITGNFISGGTGTNRMGSNAIRVAFNGQVGVANFNISNNGTAGSPITNIEGQGISVFMGGTVTGTTTVDNNIIVANQTLAAGTQGMAVQVDDGPAALGTSAADYNFIITNNSISNYEGSGIRAIARASLGKMDVTIQNNKVGTPILANRNAIRVDSGSAAGDVTVCMNMTGNTNLSNGDLTGSGVNAGIGVRKQGSVAATNDFGIVGIAAAPTNAQVQTFLDNPTNGTVGVDIISGSNYTSCAITAMLPDTNQAVAQNQSEINPVVLTQAVTTNLNTANTLAVASASVKPSEQAFAIDSAVNASATIGGGKPLFLIGQPAPAQSAETVNVSAFTLPAGKSVTIKFQVTVNGPSLPLGTTKITNQGTVTSTQLGTQSTTNGGTVDCEVGTETCTPVDRPDANVNSINRQTPSGANTNASSVTWRVTFDTPISGLTASNFTLANTGLTSPSITNVTAVGGAPATQWNVTVNTGIGDGTLGLNMTNDTGLSHDVFTLPFTGQTYTIDKTAPTVASIVRKPGSTNPTNADILGFRMTFSEAVTNVSGSDFDATGTTSNINNSLTTNITPNVVFEFFVDGTAGGDLPGLDGTVGLDVNPTTIITDLAGNGLVSAEPPAPASTNDQVYTVDNTAPTVTINQAVSQNDPTNTNPIVFTAVFSEVVTDFDDLSDVTLGGTASATVTSITGGPTTYTVNVMATTDGTVSAAIPVNKAQDSVDNSNAASTGTDNTVTYDTNAPTVTINQAVGQADPTGATPIEFTAVFSEAVTDFDDLSDVTLGGTASATVASITGGPITFTVNVTATTSGTVTATIPLNKAQDLAGNNNVVSTSTDNSVTFDATQPTVTIDQASTQVDPTGINPIEFTVVFSESVTDFDDLSDVTLSGGASATVTNISGSGTTYTVQVTATSDGTVIASINAGVATDGINTNAASTSTDNSVLYDTVDPSVTINQASTQVDPTGSNPIEFTVVFSESVTDFDDLSDVTLTGTASATVTSITESGPMDGTTYTVAVTATTNGTVIASIPANKAQDLAGRNNNLSGSTDNTVTFVPPTDLSITKTDGVATAVPGGSVTYTITASNAGLNNDPSATVADTFPASLTATWTCVGAGGGTCTAAGSGNLNDTVNLPVGGSVTYTVSAAISASATGTLSNTATVSSSITDTSLGNNSATDADTLTPQADLAITKTDGITTAVPGGSVTYTITASNAGPSNASNVTVADTFPASLIATWTCLGAGGGTCTAAGSGNINNTVNLPVGGSVTYTVSASISAATSGTLSNTATVTAPGGVTDPNPGNNSATDTDILTPQADLAITKTDGVTTAAPGGSVTYTITASNAGPSNASGATVADTFPASLTATWTCVGTGGGTCTAAGSGNINNTVNLPAGGSVTYTVSASISAAASGTLSNTATVTAPGGVTDPNPGNNSATDSDTLAPLAVTSITRANSNPTSALSVDFIVTFTESVTGVDVSDFSLTTTGVAGASITGVNGSGSIYAVTVDTGTGNGTIRLDVVDDDTIRGVGNNPLGGSGPGNGNFVTGEVYNVSKSANISVDIGGVNRGTYGIAPLGSQRVTFALDDGPVKVASTNGLPIIAALRDAWLTNGVVTSFAQLMGLPQEQLSDTYLFPVYNNVTQSEQLRFANVDTVPTTVTITIAGVVRGTYTLQPNEGKRVEFPGLDTGPLEIKSSGGAKIIAAIRDALSVNGQVTSFAQMMGLPKEKLSDAYWFPVYNNVTIDAQLRFANVDSIPTTVTVTIGGVVQGTYTLSAGESKRVAYVVDAGPVEVKSLNGAKIITAIREEWRVNGQATSYAQIMGLPKEALSTTYLFPAYNNITLDGQLRFANVDTISTNVTVTIGGVVRGTYTLNPGESKRVAYALDAGPVEVTSSNGAKIIVALRDVWKANGQVTSFAQIMGLPLEALSSTYWFPVYNNVTLSGQLRFAMP